MDDRVIDSRLSKDGDLIRRRRECSHCQRRFTTYERVDEIPLTIVKKDGSREGFDRNKIMSGLLKACEKRPVPKAELDRILDEVVGYLQENADREVSTSEIGQILMRQLHSLDKVAYVRFASVYREFKDVNEFLQEINEMFEAKN